MKFCLVLLAVVGATLAAPNTHSVGYQPITRKISHRSLLADILDFVALIPIEDLLVIVNDHVQNDAAVSYVITYLKSDDWNNLVDEVLAKPSAQDFMDYLNQAGIPVDLVIAAIRSIINSTEPGTTPDENGSLRPLLDEVEAILPVEDLVALLNDKMQNSADFQALYNTIATEKGKALVDEVLQMDEAVVIQQRLTAMGVDVQGVLETVYAFFGWGAPPK